MLEKWGKGTEGNYLSLAELCRSLLPACAARCRSQAQASGSSCKRKPHACSKHMSQGAAACSWLGCGYLRADYVTSTNLLWL